MCIKTGGRKSLRKLTLFDCLWYTRWKANNTQVKKNSWSRILMMFRTLILITQIVSSCLVTKDFIGKLLLICDGCEWSLGRLMTRDSTIIYTSHICTLVRACDYLLLTTLWIQCMCNYDCITYTCSIIIETFTDVLIHYPLMDKVEQGKNRSIVLRFIPFMA